MTLKDSGSQTPSPAAVQVLTEGDVDEEALTYLRAKLSAVLDRPGLAPVGGEVRIARAATHHGRQPWSAGAEIRVGSDLLVIHAREASAHELADRLQDRLRTRLDRVAQRQNTARRSATPPPWRGGPADGRQDP